MREKKKTKGKLTPLLPTNAEYGLQKFEEEGPTLKGRKDSDKKMKGEQKTKGEEKKGKINLKVIGFRNIKKGLSLCQTLHPEGKRCGTWPTNYRLNKR